MKLVFVLVVLSGAACLGQSHTQVSGVAKDANGNIYQNCVYSINFVGQSTQPGPYLLQGSVFQQSFAGIRCDGFGNFSIRLPSNQAIFPQPSSWMFNVCDSSGHFCNANNTAVITIAGSTQDITSILTPVLPILPPPGAAVSSVFGRTGQVVAMSGDYTVAQITGAAPLTNPSFSGLPQTPTATVGTFNNQIASTAFVMTAIGNAISGGGGGGGGWNPPSNVPGDTIFGNNSVGTGTPSFFIPGGDVSFSAGRFSVNALHFGTTNLTLSSTGITNGNCLQVSGSNLIGGPCGTGGGTTGNATGLTFNGTTIPLGSPAPTSGQYLMFDGSSIVGSTPSGGGGGGLTGCATQTSGQLICDVSVQGGTGNVGLLTLPYSSSGLPAPPTAALAAISADATGHLFWSPGNSTAFTAIGAGGGQGTAGVTSFAGRTGAVVPQASDYSAFFQPLGSGTGGFQAVEVTDNVGTHHFDQMLQMFAGTNVTFSVTGGATAGTGVLTISSTAPGAVVGGVTIIP